MQLELKANLCLAAVQQFPNTPRPYGKRIDSQTTHSLSGRTSQTSSNHRCPSAAFNLLPQETNLQTLRRTYFPPPPSNNFSASVADSCRNNSCTHSPARISLRRSSIQHHWCFLDICSLSMSLHDLLIHQNDTGPRAGSCLPT